MNAVPRLLSWMMLFGCGGAMIWSLAESVNYWLGFVAGAALFGIIALILESKHQDAMDEERAKAKANANRPRFEIDDDDEER